MNNTGFASNDYLILKLFGEFIPKEIYIFSTNGPVLDKKKFFDRDDLRL